MPGSARGDGRLDDLARAMRFAIIFWPVPMMLYWPVFASVAALSLALGLVALRRYRRGGGARHAILATAYPAPSYRRKTVSAT